MQTKAQVMQRLGTPLNHKITLLEHTGGAYLPVKTLWGNAEHKAFAVASARTVRAAGLAIKFNKRSTINRSHVLEYKEKRYIIGEIDCLDENFLVVIASEAVFKPCVATRQQSHKNNLNNPIYAPSKVINFEGAIFDKWQGYTAESAMYVAEQKLILITPKCVNLEINDIVSFDDKDYIVEIPHELDEYRNEYEIYRRDEV